MMTLDHTPSPPSAAPGRTAIEAVGIEKTYGRRGGTFKALGPIDLSIASGEFVCIVGPSGCGKSTFLRIVAGLARPSAGEMRVDIDASNRQAMSMVFQDYGIYPWKTVEQNVRFGLDLAGVRRRDANEQAARWIERLHLNGFARSYPHELSGGMRQRVAIARALATEPEILLMDEPFAALDAQLREILQEELLAIWQADQRTVVFVTHSLEEALVLSDRVVVMSKSPGRTVADLHVPFARPRTSDTRNNPEFGPLRSKLWALLREELHDQSDDLDA